MPTIGITPGQMVMEDGLHSGAERQFLNSEYLDAVFLAGGFPIVLPITLNHKLIRHQIDLIDALLLPGGPDIDPHFYGEEPHPTLKRIFPDRDEYEITAACTAYQQKKPILGICRGLQVINVAFGGTLYQDVSMVGQSTLKHYQDTKRHVPGHTIFIKHESELWKILGTGIVRVNSYHHQAIHKVAPGFMVSAQAKDGIIEGIEMAAGSVLGVEWHPEMMHRHDPIMLNIFHWLVTAAQKQI